MMTEIFSVLGFLVFLAAFIAIGTYVIVDEIAGAIAILVGIILFFGFMLAVT